jgi:hypothetical protein
LRSNKSQENEARLQAELFARKSQVLADMIARASANILQKKATQRVLPSAESTRIKSKRPLEAMSDDTFDETLDSEMKRLDSGKSSEGKWSLKPSTSSR